MARDQEPHARASAAHAGPGRAVALTGLPGPPGSRGRSGQDFFVLGAVFGAAELGGYYPQVVVHLALGEGLAELGHELPFLEVTRQDLQRLDVIRWRLAHQVTSRPFLECFLEPLLDNAADGLRLLRIFQ